MSRDILKVHGFLDQNKYAIYTLINDLGDFPGESDSKESACSVRDLGSIPGLGRSPGEGTGYPLQYFLAWRIPWTEKPGVL